MSLQTQSEVSSLVLFKEHRTRLRISITSLCNLRCVFCHKEGMSGYKGVRYMTLDKFKNIIDAYVSIGGCEINITGGEPLLHPEIKEMLSYISNFPEIHLTLSTNALLLSKVNLSIITEPISETKISFHTFNQDLATSLLGRSYDVNRVKENIIEHIIKDYRTILNFTLTTDNVNEVEELVRWVNEIGANLKISDLGVTEDNFDYVNENYLDSLEFDHIASKYSIEKDFLQGKRAGTNLARYKLINGNHILIKDRHSKQLKTEMCKECENFNMCSEGVFALRVNPNGVYQPCLNQRKFNTDPGDYPSLNEKEVMTIAIDKMFNGLK